MIRFALVSLSAFAVLAGQTWLTTAHAQMLPSKALDGEWTGKYICIQGVTGLNLRIEKGEGREISAIFDFGPLPENPDVPKGAYRMTGTYDPLTRRVNLRGEKWIKAPLDYVMVGLDGHMTAEGDIISGFVPDLFGCSDFRVSRPRQLIS